jgi:C-5 cytosine-specific DNA methylase
VKPLAIDLFCGLGGWAEGFLAEGYDVVGFDNVRHDYGTGAYPGQLVLQDVLTLDGSQFRRAAVIVASPPCVEYSYMAMPWSRAKQIARALRGEDQFPEPYTGSRTIDDLNRLFMACFRIAREAGAPLVVENVKGTEPWVGKARAHFGSFYLWGDINSVGTAIAGPVPKFGQIVRAAKRGQKRNPDGTGHPQGSWFKIADSKERGVKGTGHSLTEKGFNVANAQRFREEGQKVAAYSDPRRNGGAGKHLTSPEENEDGIKQGGEWWHDSTTNLIRKASSGSDSRRAASAQIAKIPLPLAAYIARVFRPY